VARARAKGRELSLDDFEDEAITPLVAVPGYHVTARRRSTPGADGSRYATILHQVVDRGTRHLFSFCLSGRSDDVEAASAAIHRAIAAIQFPPATPAAPVAADH